jgi:hypothetical protein
MARRRSKSPGRKKAASGFKFGLPKLKLKALGHRFQCWATFLVTLSMVLFYFKPSAFARTWAYFDGGRLANVPHWFNALVTLGYLVGYVSIHFHHKARGHLVFGITALTHAAVKWNDVYSSPPHNFTFITGLVYLKLIELGAHHLHHTHLAKDHGFAKALQLWANAQNLFFLVPVTFGFWGMSNGLAKAYMTHNPAWRIAEFLPVDPRAFISLISMAKVIYNFMLLNGSTGRAKNDSRNFLTFWLVLDIIGTVSWAAHFSHRTVFEVVHSLTLVAMQLAHTGQHFMQHY